MIEFLSELPGFIDVEDLVVVNYPNRAKSRLKKLGYKPNMSDTREG